MRSINYLHIPISTNGYTNFTQIFQEIGQHFSYSFSLVCWHVFQLLQFRWSGVQIRLKKNKNINGENKSTLLIQNPPYLPTVLKHSSLMEKLSNLQISSFFKYNLCDLALVGTWTFSELIFWLSVWMDGEMNESFIFHNTVSTGAVIQCQTMGGLLCSVNLNGLRTKQLWPILSYYSDNHPEENQNEPQPGQSVSQTRFKLGAVFPW
jgi:hypothetical protein